MNFGECIKNARKKAGLTQKELAQKAGLAEITIRQYETNKREPRNEQLRKIAHVLEITEDQLLGFDIFYKDAIPYLLQEKNDYKKLLSSKALSDTERQLYETKLDNIELWLSDFKNDLSFSQHELLELFDKLNFNGQDKAIDLLKMLVLIPEYQKKPNENN